MQGSHPQFKPEAPVADRRPHAGREIGHVAQAFNGSGLLAQISIKVLVELVLKEGEGGVEGSSEGPEVIEDQSLRGASSISDVGDTCASEASVTHDVNGGAQDPVSPFLRCLGRQCILCQRTSLTDTSLNGRSGSLALIAHSPSTRSAMATDPRYLELQARVAAFVDDVLIPLEVTAELAGGSLPADTQAHVRTKAFDYGVNGGPHSVEHGGHGWSTTEWFLVEEQLGRTTNGVSWYIPNAYNVWKHASPALQERWLIPALRGDLHDAYAVTEAEAGSDPSGMTTTARPLDDGRWVLNGEKWFVTFGSVASVIVVMAYALVDGERLPTLFAVPADTPGIETVADVPFTHTYPHGHPTLLFTDVIVSDADIIGAVGEGEDLQRMWFTEERLGIAARSVGAMQRLIEETMDWATGRVQVGARLIDHQGVSFPLADSAADAAAGRLLGLEVASMADAGADPKLVHGKASMAKLFCSEAANRCADRALQIWGGRGYMRTTAAERFWRELRVDRIWEGTSEIQRLIVARSLERRGVQAMLT